MLYHEHMIITIIICIQGNSIMCQRKGIKTTLAFSAVEHACMFVYTFY